MTFLQLQDRVLGRLNLTSDEARIRIGEFLNENYRRVQTSIGMAQVRRGTLEVAAQVGPFSVGAIKPFTITLPVFNRLLVERTLDQLREIQTTPTVVGVPQCYAVTGFGTSSFELLLYPDPADAYGLEIDALLVGVDMVDDTDQPAFPEDFHDVLIFGALEDEYNHFDRPELAAVQAQKFQRRLGDLRYFLVKSAQRTRRDDSIPYKKIHPYYRGQ